MLQERNEKSTTKGRDLLLVIGLILLAILMRLIMNAASNYAWGGFVQLGAFVLLIAAAFLLYKKRLSSYRYTLYYKDPPADALDAYGEPLRNPYPTGTLVAERMLGDKVKSAEVILPGEMRALVKPGAGSIGIISQETARAKGKCHKAVLTVNSQATAHRLFFAQGGNLYQLVFHPSEEMVRLLDAIIAAVEET